MADPFQTSGGSDAPRRLLHYFERPGCAQVPVLANGTYRLESLCHFIEFAPLARIRQGTSGDWTLFYGMLRCADIKFILHGAWLKREILFGSCPRCLGIPGNLTIMNKVLRTRDLPNFQTFSDGLQLVVIFGAEVISEPEMNSILALFVC